MDYEKIRNAILDFREERDWKQFHNPKDLATAIAIEASELQEIFLWKSQQDSYEIGKNDSHVGTGGHFQGLHTDVGNAQSVLPCRTGQ